MAADDIIAGDQVAGCSKSVEDFDLTLVAREPQTRANRAEHRTETRDKETGVGLPVAVRDRSRRRHHHRRLIVCLFDGRTKALRDKTSPPPRLFFHSRFPSFRKERELEQEGGGEVRKGSASFESSLRPTGGRIKMPRIVYCSPTRASRCNIHCKLVSDKTFTPFFKPLLRFSFFLPYTFSLCIYIFFCERTR